MLNVPHILAGALFLIGISLAIFIFLVYRKRQLQARLQSSEAVARENERVLRQRILANEKFLAQLSKDLHDNLGQLLNSSKLLVSVARQHHHDEALDLAHDTLAVALHEVRGLSAVLDRDRVETFDFIENLRAEAERLTQANHLLITLEYPNQLAMPKDRQLMLFRMVQEVCHTTVKKARSSHIRISTREDAGEVEVIVQEDYPDASAEGTRKMVMQNIKYRSSIMGGMAEWLTEPEGSRLRIQLPLS